MPVLPHEGGDLAAPPAPPVGVDPTFGDAFSQSWEAINRMKALSAGADNQADWLQDRLNDFSRTTGETVPNPLHQAGPEGQQKREDAVRARFEAAGQHYPSDEEIIAGGVSKARQAQARASALSAGPESIGARAGSVLAGLAWGATDPINAASLALLPEGLAARAAGAAVGFSGATTLRNLLTYGYQQQVNPEFGPGAVVGEAIDSAIMGAGLEVGGTLAARGLGMAWRNLSGAGKDAAPAAVRDAGTVAEKADDLRAQQPFPGLSAGGAHVEAVAATEDALNAGKQPELPIAAEREAGARRGPIYYSGGKIDARYELAEASDLIASHDADGNINRAYPPELQPRDRAAAASREQIRDIASNFEPDRMEPNSDANHGPPIVGEDNVVESGNGRTAAIRTLYDQMPDKAAEYRNWLESRGYDTAGLQDPVLIARRVSQMSPGERAAFAQSLTGSGLRLNATEQALSDARFLTPQAMEAAKAGAIDSGANRDFVRQIMSVLPQEERGAMLTKAGTPSANGNRRLEAALIARAYGEPDVVARLYDHPDPNIKTLGHGLRESAIPWAQMRDAAARGDIAAGHDITAPIMSAVKDVMRARDEGRPIWEVLNQGDMFKSDLSQQAARIFFKDLGMSKLASQKDIAANLRDYAEGALKNSSAPRLIGEPLKPEEILGSTLKKRGAEEPITSNLIDMATSREAIEKGADDPKVLDAAGADLERMREEGKNLVFTRDAEGNVSPGVIDRPMAELEAMESMAKEVRACAGGAVETAA